MSAAKSKAPTIASLTADLAAAAEQARNADKRAAAAEARADKVDADWRKRFDDLDPEARALAACVRAIDAMHNKRDRGYQLLQTSTWTSRYDPNTGERNPEPPPPPVGSSPVGRIILHLAARYGVDLGGAS